MNKKLTIVLLYFLILFAFTEILYTILVDKGINNKIVITIALFVGAKLLSDLLTLMIYKKRLFSYLEDYLKEIFVIIIISIMAGGIAWLAELLLKGNVRTTIFAVITTVYFKKNNL